jgi:hypothetical protein
MSFSCEPKRQIFPAHVVWIIQQALQHCVATFKMNQIDLKLKK